MKFVTVIVWFCLCFVSCLDIFTDKEFSLKDNICIIYSAGDGYRLAENTGNGNYSHLISSTLSEVYSQSKNQFDFLVFKAEPVRSSEAYSFYVLKLDSMYASKYKLNQISEQEYLHAVKGMYKVDYK
jgi:hypothetical protein